MEYDVIPIKYNQKEDRKLMSVRVKAKDGAEKGKEFLVPMPIEGDVFHINGVIFKINYQKNSPFRISAEVTGEVIIDVIENLVKAQEEYEATPASKS